MTTWATIKPIKNSYQMHVSRQDGHIESGDLSFKTKKKKEKETPEIISKDQGFEYLRMHDVILYLELLRCIG